MIKADYDLIANVFRETRPPRITRQYASWLETVDNLCEKLTARDAAFSAEDFRSNCGIYVTIEVEPEKEKEN